MTGRLYLIPVTLGGDKYDQVIPEYVISITKSLRHFAVEEIRAARRYLRIIDRGFPIDDSEFFILNEHTADSEIDEFMKPLFEGRDLGILSEAGLPGIADPGSRLVKIAHLKKIRVVPLSGPSSIILGLISSGFNGQNFTFNGYLPVKPAERDLKIKELERRAVKGETQIFMETPYRAHKMMVSLLTICQPDTMVCVAADISKPSEEIRTMKISEWKKNPPPLDNRLVIFIIGQ